MVTRRISDSEVMPLATFSMPSSRNVRMPISRARCLSSVAGAWSKINRWIESSTLKISKIRLTTISMILMMNSLRKTKTSVNALITLR